MLASDLIPGWLDPLLLCPDCRIGTIARGETGLVCTRCHVGFPVENGVPLFLRSSAMVDTAATLSAMLGGIDTKAIERAFGSALRYRLHDRVLRGEFSNIAERYAPHFPSLPASPLAGGGQGPLSCLAQYFHPDFLPGELAYRSIRVRNDQGEAIASVGPNPYNLSYRLWFGGREIEGIRSPFPIVLAPGAEVTIPVAIQAPAEIGDYRIAIYLVREFDRWFDDAPLYEGRLNVCATRATRDELVTPAFDGPFDFEEDLRHCGEQIARVTAELAARAPDRPLRLLELACGSDPQILRHYQPNTQVVACDLCFPQAQIGALQYQRSGAVPADHHLFLSADVTALPFQPNSFDLVVVCAALHHFADVVEALKIMRGLLRPGGRILLLREPGKVVPNDPTIIAELQAGFNEQQFELEEYATMFERAGLSRRFHQMDFDCSYKVVLSAD